MKICSFKPIVQNLLDCDWYKILMLQFIWKYAKDVPVTFSMTNRSKSIKIAKEIDINDVVEHLEYVKNLKWHAKHLEWMEAQGVFEPAFIRFLRYEFRLGDYVLSTDVNGKFADDQIDLKFPGSWQDSTMWEIYGLEIVNTLRNRAGFESLSEDQQLVAYDNAAEKLVAKLFQIKKECPDIKISDFSTRRRFSYGWQLYANGLAGDILGDSWLGTSNAFISYLNGTKPIGTSAHELPMVYTAIYAAMHADNHHFVQSAQYITVRLYEQMFGYDYSIMLPDTYGTEQFLNNPDPEDAEMLLRAKGIRVDSMEPILAGKLIQQWYLDNGIDPKTKTVIFSDGLDVDDIIKIYKEFNDVFNLIFGWGTLFGNDFRGCVPDSININPISLVIKVYEVDGNLALKLSDNPQKVIGDPALIKYYSEVFGVQELESREVIV